MTIRTRDAPKNGAFFLSPSVRKCSQDRERMRGKRSQIDGSCERFANTSRTDERRGINGNRNILRLYSPLFSTVRGAPGTAHRFRRQMCVCTRACASRGHTRPSTGLNEGERSASCQIKHSSFLPSSLSALSPGSSVTGFPARRVENKWPHFDTKGIDM